MTWKYKKQKGGADMRERIMKNRRFKWWKSVVSALSCVVVFCTTYALILPAITMENQAYCGYEEHTHDDSCYSIELICTAEDEVLEGHEHTESCYVQEKNLICEIEETEATEIIEEIGELEEHIHTEECYETVPMLVCELETEPEIEEHIHAEACYQNAFTCEKEEHTHEKICYSDKTADVETAEDWEATLPGELTGNASEDLILVAQSQLGYKESERNYIIAEDGRLKGYSRYGEWSDAPYSDWCSAFVSFCLSYAGVDESILEQKGTEYIAAPGDLICFDAEIGGYEHTAIVSEVDESSGWIKVIEGDVSGEVAYCTYELTDARITEYRAFPKEEVNEEIIEESANELIEDDAEKVNELADSFSMMMFSARNTSEINSEVALTGNWSVDLAAVAEEEKGYTVNEDGTSKYGEWYGDAAGDVSVLFPLWCLEQAGVDTDVVPVPEKTENVSTPEISECVDLLKSSSYGLYQEKAGYIAKPGDIAIIYDTNWPPTLKCLGIVTGISGTEEWNKNVTVLIGSEAGIEEKEYTYVSWDNSIEGFIALTEEQSDNEEGIFEAKVTLNKGQVPADSEMVVELKDTDEAYKSIMEEKLIPVGEKLLEDYYLEVYFAYNGEKVSVSENPMILIDFITPLKANSQSDESSETVEWVYGAVDSQQNITDVASTLQVERDGDSNITSILFAYQPDITYALGAVAPSYHTIETTTTLGNTMITATATAKSTVLNETMKIIVRNVNDNTDAWDEELKEIYETEHQLNSANQFFEIEIQDENGNEIQLLEGAKIDLKLEFLPALSSAVADGTIAHSGEWKLNYITKDAGTINLEEVTAENGLQTDTTEEVSLNSISFLYKKKDAYAVSAVIMDPDYYETIDSYEALVLALTEKNPVSQLKLCDDITVPEGSSAIEITSQRKIFLDLNGFDITTDSTLLNIRSGAEVTLLDSAEPETSLEEIAVLNLRADEDGDTEEQLLQNKENVGELAGYDEGTETLTYYVTESQVTESSNGVTEETLVKHVVKLKGVIKGGASPVFYVENGTFHMDGGAITGCTGSAILQNGGMLDLSGGYICNNHKSSENGGAICSTGEASIIVDGAVLAANSAPTDGGAIWIGGSRFVLNSGVISGNEVNESGGGVFCTGNTSVEIVGGYLTNNRAGSTDYRGGGGGIFTNEQAAVNLQGGYITGNYAESGGGGLRTFASSFRMTGGFVNSNYANLSEGGGLSINEYGIGTILGGYINNNVSNTHQHWGGGGIFSANDTTISIKNIIVTNNDAGGYGGGVAGCSTGRAFVYEEDGGAIYDNTAVARDSSNPHISGGESTKAEDHLYPNSVFRQYGYEDYFCAFNSIISGTMLGGGAANWTGTVDTIPVVVAKDEIVQSTYLMGLVAEPTTAGISGAQQRAKVYVNGNDSYTHGGGILGNGYLVIGGTNAVEVYSRLKIEASKELTGAELQDNQFEFVIENYNTGYEVATGTNDAEGNIVFDHMIPFSEEGTYEYLIYEKHTSDDEGAYEGILMDTTEYKVTVVVEKITESLEVDVNLRIDESAIVKYRYIIASIIVEKRNGGEWEFVQEIKEPDNPDSKPVSLNLTRGASFHNVITDATKFSVVKKWVGNTDPQSIWVQLMRDGEPYGSPVSLNSYNDWSYTWEEELPLYRIDEVSGEKRYYTYSVKERDTLEGYTVEYDYFNITEVNPVWIPYEGEELIEGQQYIIVSPENEYILYISNTGSDHTIGENDKAYVPIRTDTILVDGKEYSQYFYDGLISSQSIYKAERSNGTDLRLNNPSTSYRPLAIADESGGKALKSSWWPLGALYVDNISICTGYDVSGEYMVVFENNKFDAVPYDSSITNGVRLYTLAYTDPENETIFTITNSKIDEEEITYKLDLTKVSADNSDVLLAGAKFALYPADENGKADTGRQIVFVRKSAGTYQYLETKDITSILSSDVVTAVTARGGKLIITDLPKGDYVLVETEAPNGYLVTEPLSISFGTEKILETTYRIMLEDQVDKENGSYQLPDTGGPGIYVYTAGGILLLMISALLYIKQKYRRKGGIDST